MDFDWRIGHVPRAPSTAITPFLIREHTLELGLIGRVGHHALMQFLFTFVRFGGQDMAAKGMTANDLARAGFLKPFRRTFMGLELRHRNSLDPYWKELSIACGGVSDRAGAAGCAERPRWGNGA
jgi:hypothetical protein